MPAPALTADTTWGAALARIRRAFEAAGLDTPALDARVLAADALQVAAAALLAHPERPLGGGAARLAEHVRRRLDREPVARIVGWAEFWGLRFRLSPETLVPRPDTEVLVETALALVPNREAPIRILDLGTGTGCILAALLHERPRALGLATDRSAGALATARDNFCGNGLGNRALLAVSDWDAALAGSFDLIVSNPPYIPDLDIGELELEVARHDPWAALSGGADGLQAIWAVFAAAGRLLAPAGHVVVEFGHDQAAAVGEIARAAGLEPAPPMRDLGGHARVIAARRASGLAPGS